LGQFVAALRMPMILDPAPHQAAPALSMIFELSLLN